MSLNYSFDRDIKSSTISETEWTINLSEYTLPVGSGIVNGGYLFSVVIAVLSEKFTNQRPLSATAHMYNASKPGHANLKLVDINKTNKYSSAVVNLYQNDKLKITVIATFTHDEELTIPSGVAQIPDNIDPIKVLPPISECADIKIQKGTGLFTYLDVKFRKNNFFLKSTEKVPEMAGYLSHADKRPIDYKSLALFCDAMRYKELHKARAER